MQNFIDILDISRVNKRPLLKEKTLTLWTKYS